MSDAAIKPLAASNDDHELANSISDRLGEGKIADRRVLENYASGMKWTERDGKFEYLNEINDDGVPPEMLFFERCLKWIAPGGKIGIVMPKSFLKSGAKDAHKVRPASAPVFSGRYLARSPGMPESPTVNPLFHLAGLRLLPAIGLPVWRSASTKSRFCTAMTGLWRA